MKTGITLLTMGAGNVKVLRETLKSFKGIVDEVIYGDLLLWEEDREILRSYQEEFNLKIIKFDFDYIFRRGFSDLLNMLSLCSSNNLVIYANTSEIIEIDFGILDAVKNNTDCNAFFFTHKTDPHRWYRMYNYKELRWSGLIHEQLKPFTSDFKPYHKSVFQMADLPKDSDNSHKSKVLDSLKEMVYFQQYVEIVDKPDKLGETDPGWLEFAKKDFTSFKDRLRAKGWLYEALKQGHYGRFMEVVDMWNFENENYVSSIAVEFQQDKRYL